MTDHYRAATPYRAVRRSRGRSSSWANPSWRLGVSGGLLAVAIMFGGGGSPSPMTELIVELAALVAIIAWVWLAAKDRRYSVAEIDRPLYIMAALFVAIPVLQLIPLPPAIWHNLPGREIEVQALALVGRSSSWMPLSESPPRTIASALSLIPPVAMLFMVSRLGERDRLRLIGLLAALGLLAAVVGVFQLASGSASWFRFYAITNYGFAVGFQANHNADADVLLMAAMGLVAWAMGNGGIGKSRQFMIVIAALLVFLTLSIVLTGSRTGVALIVVAMVTSVAMVIRWTVIRNWRQVAAVALSVAAVSASLYLLSNNAQVQRTLDRFDKGDAVRPEIWKDTVYAVGQHWPAGSGIGTFQPIFVAAERLEFVRSDFSNRAHNDYLEFLLEAGIIAPMILFMISVFFVLRVRCMLIFKENGKQRIIGILVFGSFLVILLHSLVDYPERSLSLAVVTGMLAGLLGRCGFSRRVGSEGVAE